MNDITPFDSVTVVAEHPDCSVVDPETIGGGVIVVALLVVNVELVELPDARTFSKTAALIPCAATKSDCFAGLRK